MPTGKQEAMLIHLRKQEITIICPKYDKPEKTRVQSLLCQKYAKETRGCPHKHSLGVTPPTIGSTSSSLAQTTGSRQASLSS